MKKPSVPKCLGGSQKIFLGCSTSSLAVFYVEQVALNRHVRRHFRLLFLCALRAEMSRRKNSVGGLVSHKQGGLNRSTQPVHGQRETKGYSTLASRYRCEIVFTICFISRF
jgi:hypothetical protein